MEDDGRNVLSHDIRPVDLIAAEKYLVARQTPAFPKHTYQPSRRINYLSTSSRKIEMVLSHRSEKNAKYILRV